MKLAILGILLTACGVVLFAYAHFFAYEKDNDNALVQEAMSASIKASLPVRITATTANIDTPVSIGGFENGKWILSNRNALFLPTSKMLGEGGNTILYAHKRKGLFGALKNLSIGDVVVLMDLNGKKYKFMVYNKEDIKPAKMDKIETNKSNTLTLFTCDGWFDENRLVVKASLI